MEYGFYSKLMGMLRRNGVPETIAYAKKHELTALELIEDASGSDWYLKTIAEAEALRRTLSENGLKVSCFSVCADFLRRPSDRDALLAELPIIAATGTPILHHTLITSLTERPVPYDEALALTLDAATVIAREAAKYDLKVIYEDQGLYFNGVSGFTPFFEEIRRRCDNVGVCADFGNSLYVQEDPDVFTRAFAPYVMHVHVKDYIRKLAPEAPSEMWNPAGSLGSGVWLRATVPGDGIVNLPACVEALKRVGYDGCYSLELEHSEPFDFGIDHTVAILRKMAQETY